MLFRSLALAGASGLATTALGMVVAFLPPPQVQSAWKYELKMFIGCAVFLGLTPLISRWRAGRRAAVDFIPVGADSGASGGPA